MRSLNHIFLEGLTFGPIVFYFTIVYDLNKLNFCLYLFCLKF